MRKYERSVEEDFIDGMRDFAIETKLDIATLKMNLQGRRGWPDRLVLWSGGNMVFIEFKRPGEDPRKLQEHVHGILRRAGFAVLVHDIAKEALEDVKARIRATTTTDASPSPWRDAGGVPPVSETGEGEDSSSFESVRHPLSGG
jgi:hypothetical protein